MLSKEQIEARLHHRQEAAIRRERALAYAYTHQVIHAILSIQLELITKK